MRYVAFLRAINVGGRWVKMDELRRHFVKFGMKNVETFIASGNVLFDSDDDPATLEPYLEAKLQKALGITSETFLRTGKDLASVAKCTPFREIDVPLLPKAHGLWVGFLRSSPPAANRTAVALLGGDNQIFKFRGRELYWYSQERTAMLKITGKKLERTLGGTTTFRSITSVRKLAEMLGRT
jgi:uncharacterized protein (DUF1697 family)